MVESNVWAELFTETDVARAENLVTAAIGADKHPAVLIEQLRVACDEVAASGAVAERLLPFASALIAVACRSLGVAVSADLAAWATEDEHMGAQHEHPDLSRRAALETLSEVAEALKLTLRS